MNKPYCQFFICIAVILTFFCSYGQKDSTNIKLLMDKAFSVEISNPEDAIKQYQKTYDLSIKSKWYKGAFKSMQNIGFVHSDNGRYDLSIEYYQKAFPYAKKANYTRGIGTTYINMGNSYQYKGDYEKSISLYLKGIPILESIKDSSAVSQSYQNLSAMYATIKNLPLEELYEKKAIESVKNADTERKGIIYCDFALFYIRQNKYEMALEYLNKAKALTKINSSKSLAFYLTRNFGEYYKFMKQYSKAIPYYENALVLTESLNDAFQKNDLLYILSGMHILINDYQTALKYGIQSLDLATKNDSKEIIYRSQKRLAIIYNHLKQPQKAFDLLEKSYTLKDTFLTESHIKQMTLTQTQFETEKKDKAIAEQQIKLKKQELNLIKNQKQKQLYYISIAVLILLSFGIWYFFKQRQKLKNKEIEALKKSQEIAKLEALIDGEEKERKRIAQELHDGLNGDLSAIKYRLSTLEDSGLSAIDTENITKVINMIDESCAQVRSISHNLMPSSILEYGLVETIKEYCIKINNTDNFRIDFQSFGDYITLSKKTETVVYRIIQELVTNILKHAKATEAMIQFNIREDEFFITVEDNGIGFDKTKISEGIGHKNIQTRVDFLNAQLNIDSSPSGTSYTIAIDLNKVK